MSKESSVGFGLVNGGDELAISIVMCCHNEEQFICQSIDSIYKFCEESLFELILVDDASSDGTPDLIRGYTYSNLKIIENQTSVGISASRNLGIQQARGRIALFLDAHIRLVNDLTSILIEAFTKYKNIAGVTGGYFSNSLQDFNSIRDVVRAFFSK